MTLTGARPMTLTKVAITGSGNIGTGLIKIKRLSTAIEVAALLGIDPDSEGLPCPGGLGRRHSRSPARTLLDYPSCGSPLG